MNLKEYLFYKNQTLKEFALIADISACHLSSVMTGYRTTTPKLLRAIERATEGWVKPNTAFAETKLPEGFKAADIIPLPIPEKQEDDESLKERIG
jgi:transcriptional regulator with XRE-family HTH domain